MEGKISVIIPAYNAELTISKCIDAVLKSLHDNDELIIIDDGSTDNTARICIDYAHNIPNVIYKYQQNNGAFSARITGLKYATGNYISFIDADDICTCDRYHVMHLLLIEHEADLFFFRATIKKKKHTSEINNIDLSPGCYSGQEIFEQYGELLFGRFNNDKKTCSGYVWNTLIKKELIESLMIYRDERIELFEDEIILIISALNARKCIVTNQNLYTYDHSNDNTASKKKGYWTNYWENIVTVYSIKKKIAIDNNVYTPETQARLSTFLATNCLRSIYNETSYDNSKSILQAINYSVHLIPNELKKDLMLYHKDELYPYERALIWMQLKNMGIINYWIYYFMYSRMKKFRIKKRNK